MAAIRPTSRKSWDSYNSACGQWCGCPWLRLSQLIEGEKEEAVTDFIFSGSKNTGDGGCSHEIKRCSLPGRKAMTNLDSVIKSRHITLLTKVRLVKAMVLPVVIYGCEKEERQR